MKLPFTSGYSFGAGIAGGGGDGGAGVGAGAGTAGAGVGSGVGSGAAQPAISKSNAIRKMMIPFIFVLLVTDLPIFGFLRD
jgi:hypothetical protein